ncbi:MAG: DNA replication protein psf2 [Sarcosagium campestre]|nr:MAG: DNA replication protein psf2 [Sarcosagium campestre]
MAFPLPPRLSPAEITFLCEMEMVTVIPRQTLDSLDLLGGPTQALKPPYRTTLPLWLALMLKQQGRANILPPPWLHPVPLAEILQTEIEESNSFSAPPPLPAPVHGTRLPASPPFLASSTGDAPDNALPYHWLEMGETLLRSAADDLVEPDAVRSLLRDLREVRMAKIRAGVSVLDGAGPVSLKGVGSMEVGEGRAFIGGVVNALRKITASREQTRRKKDLEARQNQARGDDDYDEDDDEEVDIEDDGDIGDSQSMAE